MHNSTLQEITAALIRLETEQFAYVGTFELITGVITFLGLLFALSRRIGGEYGKMPERLFQIRKMLKDELENLGDDKSILLDRFDQYVFNATNIAKVEYHKREYTINHFVCFFLGVFVLVGYGLALLTEELPYSFFATMTVIVVSMCPTVIHAIRHHRQTVKFSSTM